MGPHMVEIFLRERWTKDDVRNYIIDNAKISIADLKRRGTWGKTLTDPPKDILDIQPGDESKLLYLFKDSEYDGHVLHKEWAEDHDSDVFILVAGGDAGPRMLFTVPYQVASNPVTKLIRIGR
jgi:hypothetical protein